MQNKILLSVAKFLNKEKKKKIFSNKTTKIIVSRMEQRLNYIPKNNYVLLIFDKCFIIFIVFVYRSGAHLRKNFLLRFEHKVINSKISLLLSKQNVIRKIKCSQKKSLKKETTLGYNVKKKKKKAN